MKSLLAILIYCYPLFISAHFSSLAHLRTPGPLTVHTLQLFLYFVHFLIICLVEIPEICLVEWVGGIELSPSGLYEDQQVAQHGSLVLNDR